MQWPMKQRRKRHLERKYEKGTLTYREFVELLTEGHGRSKETANEFWVSYSAKHLPGYGETFVF